MLTRVLAVATALLAALVIHLYNQVGQLRTQVADAQSQAVQRARSIASDSMEGQTAEVERVMKWLNDFYKAPDGLQRKEGLWIEPRQARQRDSPFHDPRTTRFCSQLRYSPRRRRPRWSAR